MSSEDFFCKRNNLATVLGHFNKGSHNHGFSLRAAVGQFLLDHIELSCVSLAWLISDKVPELRQDKGSNFYHCFVQTWRAHNVKHF